MDMEILMNLQYFLLVRHKEQTELEAAIPTILYHFYNNELLLEDFLNEYENEDNKKVIKKHWLFKKEVAKAFRKASKPFRRWFKHADYEEEERKIEIEIEPIEEAKEEEIEVVEDVVENEEVDDEEVEEIE